MKIDPVLAAGPFGRALVVALTCATCSMTVATSSFGQQSKAPTKKASGSDGAAGPSDEGGFLVIPLKYADASQVQQLLLQVHGKGPGAGTSVIADSRTNSLIVRATSSDSLQVIPELVRKLDVPATDEPVARRLPTKIYHPQSISLDSAVVQQLRVAISEQGRFAVDENRNIVVVQDTQESQVAFEELLRMLDQGPVEKPAPTALRLRVVWLTSGTDRRDAPAIPADLKGVIDDLAKSGVEGLQLAAQTIVYTAASGSFQVQCSPDLESPCDLKISGGFSTSKGKTTNLQIEIGATERGPARVDAKGNPGFLPIRNICNLNTTIATPLGHAVVLGSAPVGKLTSVFVVQVTAAD